MNVHRRSLRCSGRFFLGMVLALSLSQCATRESRTATAPVWGAVAGGIIGAGVGALAGDVSAGATAGYYTGLLGGAGYTDTMVDKMPVNPESVYKAAPTEIKNAQSAWVKLDAAKNELSAKLAQAKAMKDQNQILLLSSQAAQKGNECAMWENRMNKVEWTLNSAVEGKLLVNAQQWQNDRTRLETSKQLIKSFKYLKKDFAKMAR